ncbi:nitrogenase component 1 [Megasphaera cerevisiae]|uniref:nitrogenase component 1 n=1 Tax=Megasphaera cerevisiae TaxID=39029 RepID=UPI000941DD45|nr:nitrogenase component 1 [Megasphaera cerevisiae]OKY53024.1 nitrogenase molybdenum-iron protein subunit beta [Megasphaera cerevisiae]
MLDATPKKIVDRTALRVNPCKTCQPVGAMYCALGVHQCMPHSHGSQGCCSYHRTVLSRHFKEPAIATTSSFTEGACVFGGGSNLKKAVKNIFETYDPYIIAVHTTCLSETIGDDLKSYIDEIDIPAGKLVIHTNTPSYIGSHITGFGNMMCGFINYLSKKSNTVSDKIGIFPGFVNPGDMRELKRLATSMEAKYIMFPDTSDVMDAPNKGTYQMYPKGGTTVAEIKELGSVRKVLGLGTIVSKPAAEKLKVKCGVDFDLVPYPIGIRATDTYLMKLSHLYKTEIPAAIADERGRVLDGMIDAQQYFAGKKVAVYGDPDIVLGIAAFCLELGMIPYYMITGTPSDAFEKEGAALFEGYDVKPGVIKANADLFYMQQLIKNDPVELLIGNTHGKLIAKAEDIPIVRAGFPVMDRYFGAEQPIVGYRGAMRLAEMILNALLDRKDRDADDTDLELVL